MSPSEYGTLGGEVRKISILGVPTLMTIPGAPLLTSLWKLPDHEGFWPSTILLRLLEPTLTEDWDAVRKLSYYDGETIIFAIYTRSIPILIT